MDKLGVVGMNDRWVRAIRKRLPNGLPRPGCRLGQFYAEDMEVLDSYVYRLVPLSESAANGRTAKYRKVSNGASTTRKAPVESGA